jgi:hypothetical protein
LLTTGVEEKQKNLGKNFQNTSSKHQVKSTKMKFKQGLAVLTPHARSNAFSDDLLRITAID